MCMCVDGSKDNSELKIYNLLIYFQVNDFIGRDGDEHSVGTIQREPSKLREKQSNV